MLRQGPVPVTLHAMLEPLLAALFIAAPFLLGFSDQGAPTAVSIVVGVLVLLVAMSTCWRISLIKAIPLPAHLMIDLGTAALLIAAPFLFGFSDRSGPTAFFLGMGILDLLMALATRWLPARADAAPGAAAAAEGPRFSRREQPRDPAPAQDRPRATPR